MWVDVCVWYWVACKGARATLDQKKKKQQRGSMPACVRVIGETTQQAEGWDI